MKCPEGLTWIPDREYCSRCQPGYAWNAEWSECVKMDRTVISPGQYHTASASFFGYDRSSFGLREGEKKMTGLTFLLMIIVLGVILGRSAARPAGLVGNSLY